MFAPPPKPPRRPTPGPRSARRRACRCLAALALALAALPVPGCLDDLPPTATCPGEAQRALGDCTPAIQTVLAENMTRCFRVDEMECITGPRTKCSCVSDECPAPEPECWPGRDCPTVVFDKTGPEARCYHFDPGDIGASLVEESQCLCGCAGCAAVCDGTGPGLGALTVEGQEQQFAPVVFDLGTRLPRQGKLGIYGRVRGLANFVIVAIRGDINVPDELEYLHSYAFLTPLQNEFSEQAVVDQLLIGPAYEWDGYDGRPNLLVLFPQLSDKGGLSLFELDCLVPFVMPR